MYNIKEDDHWQVYEVYRYEITVTPALSKERLREVAAELRKDYNVKAVKGRNTKIYTKLVIDHEGNWGYVTELVEGLINPAGDIAG